MDRSLIRELAAECLGTFLLIVFGVGSVAQMVLSHHTLGTTLSVNIGWGLAVMLGAYASAGVSGAHLNPAVSIAFAAFRDFPWRKVVPYAMAQTARRVPRVRRRLRDLPRGARRLRRRACGRSAVRPATAGIWATYPQPYLSIAGGFVDQVVGTALLLMGLFALVDAKNANLPHYLVPVAAGRARARHRRDLRHELRLRDQPGARLRTAALHRRSRAGAARSSGPATAGGGCRSSPRRWAR